MGLALRRPIYFGFGWVCLGVAALGMAASPREAVALAVALAVVSGIACAGSAARAQALAGRGAKAPWSAWFGPWAKGARLAHAARLGVGAAAMAALALGAQLGQAALLGAWGGEPAAGFALFVWGLGMWSCLLWALAMAAPVGSWAAWGRLAGRALGAPMALVGLCLFWGLWIALADVCLAAVLVQAVESGGARATMEVRASMGALAALVSLALSAPMMAMSAGLASVELADELPGSAAERPPPAAACPEPEAPGKAERKAQRRERDARTNG